MKKSDILTSHTGNDIFCESQVELVLFTDKPPKFPNELNGVFTLPVEAVPVGALVFPNIPVV